MKTPVSIDETPVSELALQLGHGDLPQWMEFDGRPLDPRSIALLLHTSLDFQVFWQQRHLDEIAVLERIQREADFLDQRMVDFFAVRTRWATWLGEACEWKMVDWVCYRLKIAREAERQLAS